MKNNVNKLEKEYVFAGIILFSIFIFGIVVIFTKGEIVTKIFLGNIQDTFMDHFNSIYDCFLKRPYDVKVIYPPLCNTIYWIISTTIPKELFLSNWYTFPGGSVISTNQTAILSVVILISLSILIILHVFVSNKAANKRILLSFSICFSMPMMYAIERGNIIIFSVALIMFFIKYKDSKNIILKEIACISLAVAAALKIYPAIFGLILIKEKKYNEAIRTVVYGIILFFVPFLVFGGVDAFLKLVNNLLLTTNFDLTVGYGNKIGFTNLFLILNKKIVGSNGLMHLARVANYIYLVFLLVSFIFVKEKWKQYALLSMICININSFSYVYCILFLLPALYEFMKINYLNFKIDIIYLSLFICMFIYIPIGQNSFFYSLNEEILSFSLYWDSFSKCLSINIFGILIIVEEITKLVQKRILNIEYV